MSTQVNSAKKTVVPAEIVLLRAAGFALHWLHAASKRPIGECWSTAPVATLRQLQDTYRQGNNVGVRLGEPSRVAGGFLHCLDIDVRVHGTADVAWRALRDLLPDVHVETLPSVVSGSGGESRHVYFVTDKPFHSRKLWVSGEKFRGADGKWHHTAEIDLMGTGRQCVLPPSIHPDTGAEYAWERPFDLDLLALGVAPTIPAERLSEITDPVNETYEFETVEPLTFKDGQLERELDEIPDERIDDYADWITLGQALHHQFGGSTEGYDLWLKHSQRSEKFDAREMPGKWRSFGRNRRRPVTMATVRQWVLDERRQTFADAFDDLPEPDGAGIDPTVLSQQHTNTPADVADLLGGDAPAPSHDPLDDDVELPWQSLLDFNPDTGAIRPTLHNVTLMVQHDARIAGLPQRNKFTQQVVQRIQPARQAARKRRSGKPIAQLNSAVWTVDDPINGTLWNDKRDDDVRRVFEAPKTQAGYGIKVSDRDLTAAINSVAELRAFHPIQEYLEGISWDGKGRCETLFIDYLGAPDNAYTRDIARLMLIAAVCRVYEPGHKWDHAVIIEGKQGRGKSTFIKILGRTWFSELDGDFGDSKQMIEQMMGAWILEIPELSAFSKADVRNIKAFISRSTDRARLAYDRRASEFPRQSILIGSTNDRSYLRDPTGARRFWAVECTVDTIDFEGLTANIDQVWAEALHLYREMRRRQPRGTLPLYLRDEASHSLALEFQRSRTLDSSESILAGVIAAWLDKPIATGDMDSVLEGKLREFTCVKEILDECLRDEPLTRGQGTSQMIGRAMDLIDGWESCGSPRMFPKYGMQRAFRRKFTPRTDVSGAN